METKELVELFGDRLHCAMGCDSTYISVAELDTVINLLTTLEKCADEWRRFKTILCIKDSEQAMRLAYDNKDFSTGASMVIEQQRQQNERYRIGELEIQARAGKELAKSIVNDVDCKQTDHELSTCPKCWAVSVYTETISAYRNAVKD